MSCETFIAGVQKITLKHQHLANNNDNHNKTAIIYHARCARGCLHTRVCLCAFVRRSFVSGRVLRLACLISKPGG